MELEKNELVELKIMLEETLKEIDFQIEIFSPNEDDEKFSFLIKKAISYRDIIKRINQELNEI